MPYTKAELESLSFYTNLINEDEQQYLNKKERLALQAAASGSANNGALIRDASNTILLFENPFKNQLLEDEESKVVYDLRVKKLKTGEGDTIIEEVLNRRFREL